MLSRFAPAIVVAAVSLAPASGAGQTAGQFMHDWGSHFAKGEYRSLYDSLHPAQRERLGYRNFARCFAFASFVGKRYGVDFRTYAVTRTAVFGRRMFAVPATTANVQATLVVVYSSVKVNGRISTGQVQAHLAPAHDGWTWMLAAASLRSLRTGDCTQHNLDLG